MRITIREAQQSDLPAMIAICCAAMEPDVVQRFLYSQRQAEAVRIQTESLMASLGARFTQPTNRCYLHKAVDDLTGDIIGWSLVRWEDGSWVSKPSNTTDDRFISFYGRTVKQNWLKILGENKPHVGE